MHLLVPMLNASVSAAEVLSRFEYEYLGWSAGTLGRLVRISILMLGNLIAELFVILFFSSIPDWIHKLIAIRKYC
uniref:hypothetical protein n=1 Tax=Enterococcus faecium TaxID=1352 RepID=UPI001C0EE6AB